MSRFATKAGSPPSRIIVPNEAGGDAYAQGPKLALASLVLTSVVIDSAYRSGEQELVALTNLIKALRASGGLVFVAQCALYARFTHGLRTISHVLAGELALIDEVLPWRKAFFDKIVKRPDDAIEIASYVRVKLGGKKMLPNALKRGLAKALVRFDEYSLAKYSKKTEGLSLIDLVNLVHPKAPKTHAVHKLMKGTIASALTWELLLSEAGQQADPAKAKAAAWKKIFAEEQMGYMGCLMNLRNIMEQAPKVVPEACKLLMDEKQIAKSLIMPTQFISAFKAIEGTTGPEVQQILTAINVAIEIAMANVPKLAGRTLIALDASGSMDRGGAMKYTPFEIGALFASTLYKANPAADFMYFADNGQYRSFDRDQKLLALREVMVRNRITGGTSFHAIFQAANRAYDRVVILSDMQAWISSGEWHTSNPAKSVAEFCKRTSCEHPMIFSFDLKSYGTAQFLAKKVCALAGWSDKVFDVMKQLEQDRNALVNTIEAIPCPQ